MGEPMPRATRTRGVLAVVLIFVLGVVTGAAVLVLVERTTRLGFPPPRREPPMHAMTRELGLDAAQAAEIRRILHRDRTRIHAILEESRQEIRAILTPEQQRRFDALHPGRPHEMLHGPGGGPGGRRRGGPEGPPGPPPPPPPPQDGG